jgi:hypothetical protein
MQQSLQYRSQSALGGLLDQIARYPSLAMEVAVANSALSTFVSSLIQSSEEDSSLKALLHKFGWQDELGFTKTLDVGGFRTALQKFKWRKVEYLGTGAFGVVHKALVRRSPG